jgi:hypothetical protein
VPKVNSSSRKRFARLDFIRETLGGTGGEMGSGEERRQ